MLIDTHAHLDFPDFQGEVGALIERAQAVGVERIFCVGINRASSQRVIELAENHPALYAIIGLHPTEEPQEEAFLEELETLASHEKVLAIGEMGLDYYRLPAAGDSTQAPERTETIAWQKRIFRAQLAIADKLRKNVVIHQRAAWDDTLAILDEYAGVLRAVFHCFGEDWQRAQKVLARGHLLSFTGIATFKNASDVRDTLSRAPSGSWMLETDCPYLAPVPYRGKRCEPAYVKEIAQRAAELRNQSLEETAAETTQCAEKFFGLD